VYLRDGTRPARQAAMKRRRRRKRQPLRLVKQLFS
jgi:hypothetical protein